MFPNFRSNQHIYRLNNHSEQDVKEKLIPHRKNNYPYFLLQVLNQKKLADKNFVYCPID